MLSCCWIAVRSVVSKLLMIRDLRSVIGMTALQNSAFGQRFAARRRRNDVRDDVRDDVRQLAEARFAVDRARYQALSTMVGPR
jgi:hypothetical protein